MTSDAPLDNVEVWISLAGDNHRVGSLYRQWRRSGETVSFRYHPEWLGNPRRFELKPGLRLTDGTFRPPKGRQVFDTISGD